jgi:Na+/H+-dicarboxylate symporter
MRFGTIIHFAVAAMFMGTLLGRSFSLDDIVVVAALSVVASFGTLGLSGPAALAPLAAVLRPFGLSYELAVPLLIVLEPIANMIRVVLNVAVNCIVPALAVGGPTRLAPVPP